MIKFYIERIAENGNKEDSMKYSEWLNFWLENYIKPSVKQKTYLRYKEIVEKQIGEQFDVYGLNELTPMLFQQFVTELLTSGNAKTGGGLSGI